MHLYHLKKQEISTFFLVRMGIIHQSDCRRGKVFFKMAGVKSDKIQFVSSVEKCRNAEIFVDGRTIEVYLNDGEDVGTRLFYNSNRQGIFCLNSEKDAQVKICEMKSIWK